MLVVSMKAVRKWRTSKRCFGGLSEVAEEERIRPFSITSENSKTPK
jgi:hypothetical protein